MKRPCWLIALFTAAVSGQAPSRPDTHAVSSANDTHRADIKATHTETNKSVPALHPTELEKGTQRKTQFLLRINPPLKDVSSDKKFFGPPFPADYPDDQRPTVKQSVLDDIRKEGHSYPALQSKADFDRDFVKDENSDKGHWKAQFEYDAARKKLSQEEADHKKAQERADKEKHDVDEAQKRADAAGKKAGDAQKHADAAKSGENAAAASGANAEDAGKGDDAGKGEDADKARGKPGEVDPIDEMKVRISKAEANYELEKKQFQECQKQLEEAKAELQDVQTRLTAMEHKSASDAKFFAEQKAVKLNLKKAKKDAAIAKRHLAESKLAAAQATKSETDKVLALQKAHRDEAQNTLQEKSADVQRARESLEKARLHLQKLRGDKVAPLRSGSVSSREFRFALALLALAVPFHVV